jgi:carboxymethylenebutenolidase
MPDVVPAESGRGLASAPMGQMIEFASNGSTAQGYLAGASGPGLVVVQEWWGLVPHIEALCERFAAEGFVALAPDLYHGTTTTEPDEAGKLVMALDMERAAKDLGGAVDEVASRSSGSGVGVVGFCMGGGLALLTATQRGDKVKATAPFYGLIPPQGPTPDWSRLGGPVQGHYAEDDDLAGPAAVEKLRTEIAAAGGEVELFVYPGTSHAFFNDTRPEVHDPEASATAWQRTLAFFRANL